MGEILETCKSSKNPYLYDSLNFTNEGKRVWESSTITPIFDKNGTLSNYIIIDTDITKQKDAEELVSQKNQDITDSINYAKRIQAAILPANQQIIDSFNESFILYLPKDIVAGDFYWLEKTKDTILFAVADCTGHGVPGAMVSVICNNGLNRCVREYNITQPSKILDKTREIVIQEFAKSKEDIQDGMDIALCSIKGNKLNYSGANNPLIIIRNKEVIQIKADRQPIGKYIRAEDFTNHTLDIQKDDMIYIFSDGFADQFGGKKCKKYRLTNLLILLTKISTKVLSEQHTILKEEFLSWKGTEDQIDDVCVMGVRV
jgi:serine phosphatase RsbU (regulator of sigma subunit)